MKRRILIHTRVLSIPGGKQTYLLALQDYFTNDVEYFYYGAKSVEKESKIQFIKRFIGDYIHFYRLLKRERFDAVHINTSFNPKSYFRDSVFTWISKKTGHNTLVYWHGWRPEFEKRVARKARFFYKWTFGKADAMICLAREFSDKLKAYPDSNMVFLETTVVENDIINPPEIWEGQKNEDLRILFLSRLEKVKGIYEALESFKILRNKFTNLKLIIGGVGGELENAQAYARRHLIQDVDFLGWIENELKIRTLYDADIFIFPSYHDEGMPISLLEAMASGKPVITTRPGGIRDFFVEGKMGFEVAAKDPKDLARKIEHMIREPKLRQEIGRYNAVFAKEHFSPQKICKRLETIYEAIITKS